MPIPIPNADALRRMRDVVLRVEASPPGEALGAKDDGRPAQPFALVTPTSATKTDARFPGKWLRFEDNAFGAGEETCWILPTNDVALRVGRRYRALLMEYRSTDGYPIFLVDRDSPRVGQVTLSEDEASWDLSDYDLVEVDVDAFSGPDTKTISDIAGGYNGRQIKLWFKPLASSTRYVAFESSTTFDHGGNGLSQTTVTVAPNQGALVTVTYWDSKWFVSAELNFDAQYTGAAADLSGAGTQAGWAVMWGLNSRALWRGGYWGGNGSCGIARNHTFGFSRLGTSPSLLTVPGASETAWSWPTSSHVHYDYRAESAGSVIHGITFPGYGRMLLVSVNAGSYSLTFKHQSGSNAASAVRCATGADIVMNAAHSMVLLIAGGDSGSGGDTTYIYAIPLFGLGGTPGAGSIGTTELADDAVTYAKLQNVSGTDKILGRVSSGAGNVEEIPFTAAARDLADDPDAATMRATLGLVIGTDVQAQDATLQALAGLTIASNSLMIGSGTDAFSVVSFGANTFPGRSSTGGLVAKTITDFAFGLLDDTDASAMLNTLGGTTIGKNLFALSNPGAVTFPRFNLDNTVSALSAANFRTAIGATTVGANIFTATNPSAIRFLRINADNTIDLLSDSDFRTAIGAGTASGTVTSVALSLPSFISVSGSPVTTTGTLTGTLATQAAKTFFCGPTSGSDAAPTFRVIAVGDLPLINGLPAADTADSDDIIAVYDSTAGANARISLLTAAQIVQTARRASQSDMETATDNTRNATALSVKWHPGVAKGWINFNGTGTIATRTSHNVSGISDLGTGLYQVDWDTDFSSANNVPVPGAGLPGFLLNASLISAGSIGAGSCQIATYTSAGTLTDADVITCVAFGDQ